MQPGHLKNLCVLSPFSLKKKREILVLTGHQIFINLSFSARRLGIFLERSLKTASSRSVYERYSKKARPTNLCTTEIIREKMMSAIFSWSGPYLPSIKFLRKFLITYKPPYVKCLKCIYGRSIPSFEPPHKIVTYFLQSALVALSIFIFSAADKLTQNGIQRDKFGIEAGEFLKGRKNLLQFLKPLRAVGHLFKYRYGVALQHRHLIRH